MNRVRFVWLVLIFSFFASSQPTWARWATREDAQSETEFENDEIQINADGSHTDTISYRVKILKDSARDHLATRRLVYNATISSIDIIEAKTINDGVEYPVQLNLIEDKPLASSPKGFDQHHQILIAFPQIRVHSEIYLKYKMTVKQSPLPGFFSTSLVYGTDSYEKSGKVKILSALPLHVFSNDPDHSLKINQETLSQGSHKYSLEVQLKKPTYRQAIDETDIQVNPTAFTFLNVSTAKDWSTVAQPILSKYEAVLDQPLPPLFEKILIKAKKQKGRINQINTITSQLAEHINYMGDWRPISGFYIPRNLMEIADTKLADCKDFSAATASILKKLGLKAHIAWIERGVGTYDSLSPLPTLSEFNHAIVYLKDGDQTYWIDPTNFSSFAQGTYPDIENRKALVLNPEKITLERTPALDPKDGVVTFVKNVSLGIENEFHVQGHLKMHGTAAVPYAGLSLKASKQSIDYNLIRAIGDESRITEWKVDNYDLSSRIIQDLAFNFQFLEKDAELKTTAGSAFTLPAGSTIPLLLTPSKNRVSDLFLGVPMTLQKEIIFSPIVKQGSQSLDCKLESPWVNAMREVVTLNHGVKVLDSISIKQSRISNSDLKSAEFLKFQKKLQHCFSGVAIIYSRDSSGPSQVELYNSSRWGQVGD